MPNVSTDFGRAIDLTGIRVMAAANIIAAGVPEPTGPLPVHGMDWVWLWITLAANGANPTPANLLVTPQATSSLNPTTATDWSSMPYEPAVAGTGTVVVYNYVITKAYAATTHLFRVPVFGSWMRFQIDGDTGGSSFLAGVLAQRAKIGGPSS